MCWRHEEIGTVPADGPLDMREDHENFSYGYHAPLW